MYSRAFIWFSLYFWYVVFFSSWIVSLSVFLHSSYAIVKMFWYRLIFTTFDRTELGLLILILLSKIFWIWKEMMNDLKKEKKEKKCNRKYTKTVAIIECITNSRFISYCDSKFEVCSDALFSHNCLCHLILVLWSLMVNTVQ